VKGAREIADPAPRWRTSTCATRTIYENPPDFVEGLARTMLDHDIKPEIKVFDLAMLYNAANRSLFIIVHVT
jgi:uncharacterized protein (DUF849 family)